MRDSTLVWHQVFVLNDDRHNDASPTPCHACEASGYVEGTGDCYAECIACTGHGQIWPECDDAEPSFDCEACMGTGEGYAGLRCSDCRGSGVDRRALKRAYEAGREDA